MKNKPCVPRKALNFLLKFMDFEERENFSKYVDSVYGEIFQEKGRRAARIWFWSQYIRSLPRMVKISIGGNFIMFKNYLKTALRNMQRHKGYTFINIAGLAIGLACTILILIWVQDELSYDRFHRNAASLYRVSQEYHFPDGLVSHSHATCPPLSEVLKTEYPEIINSTRFRFLQWQLKSGEDVFVIKGALVDPSFFEMFTFPFVKGNPDTALSDPHSIVLMEETAENFFGQENPIGKTIRVSSRFDASVSGVIKNIPVNSHLRYGFVIPFEILRSEFGYTFQDWNSNNHYTYVQLQKGVPHSEVDQKISGVVRKHFPNSNAKLYLTPLTRIYLYKLGGGGNITYIYIFSIMAVFLMLIACINFMNLTTARSSSRIKEIGVRKVAGAKRTDVIMQFYGESILFVILALFFAIILVCLMLPVFNSLTGKQITISLFGNTKLIFGLMGLTLLTGIISGSYPSLFLSSFLPAKVLKGLIKSGTKSSTFRKILIVFQFSLSIYLVIGSIVIFNQLDYMRNKDLGYNKDNIICLNMNRDFHTLHQVVKSKLQQNPGIINVTVADTTLAYAESTTDNISWEGKKADERVNMECKAVDYDYLKTLELEMAEGRFFSEKFPSDATKAVVVNESAVKTMGMDSPVGKQFSWHSYDFNGTIIGVIKDFHSSSLHRKISPMFLILFPDWIDTMLIRIKSENTSNTIGFIKSTLKELIPDYPFAYTFLDEDLNDLYIQVQRMGRISRYFTFLALFISGLGLFGLTSYMAEQRTKEIGIRKIVGASVSRIVILFSKDLTKWVLAANLFAWPIGYYTLNQWLQNFVYRTNINPLTFILSSIFALVIAFLSVSYQTIKAATANPVDSLRYE